MKELDGIELIYEKGLFKIFINSALCYCDYIRCIEIIETDKVEQNSSEFIDIIRQGKFLKSINFPEFDSFKEDMEKILEPALLVHAENSFNNEEYNQTIILCEAISYIDPINDDVVYYTIHALTKLKLNSEAQKQYFLFVKEYKKMMGKEYPVSFSELSSEKKRTQKK
jgi:two-component SAPR family response regulator